jgi:hypothetical protein
MQRLQNIIYVDPDTRVRIVKLLNNVEGKVVPPSPAVMTVEIFRARVPIEMQYVCLIE